MNKNCIKYSLNKNKKNEYIRLITNNGVFKPTETTKFLLEAIIKKFPTKKKINILDLGCGNGVVGIYLLKKYKNINSLGFADTSLKAILNTKANCELNKISKKKIKFFKSNVFNNIGDYKFDIIINDISGVSYRIAKISNWFKNVPCESGDDGTKLTLNVLKNFKFFLNSNGTMFLPLISFSNVKKVFDFMKKKKIKNKLISTNEWPIPKDMYKHISIMKKLKKSKKISYEDKYGLIVANTKIVQTH